MMKSASGHEYGADEPLELRTAPVVDSTEYVARILCTGCGRDFDVLRSDKAGYAPIAPAHAHGTPDVGGAGCRSLSVVPIEPEPHRRGPRSTRNMSSFQTVPGRGTDCSGACSCPGPSSMSDACADSATSDAFGTSRCDATRTCAFWAKVDDAHMTMS